MTGTELLQLPAQFADEDIDNLHLRFIDPAVEMVQECILCQYIATAQDQQLENSILLAGELNVVAID